MAQWQRARFQILSSRVRLPGEASSLSTSPPFAEPIFLKKFATFNNHLKFSPLKELLKEKECQVKSDLYG